MRALVDVSNLFVGGGVQAACAVVEALSGLSHEFEEQGVKLSFTVSPVVHQNLLCLGFVPHLNGLYRVAGARGVGQLFSREERAKSDYDLVFTLFGPRYRVPGQRPIREVVGFAQAWIAYPNGDAWRYLPMCQRWKLRAKFAVQWLFFLSANRLVVELPHVRNALVAHRGYPADCIEVVPNCVSPVFFDTARWRSVLSWPDKSANDVWLGYLTRDYPHKNLEFLVALASELRKKSSLRYRFFVTLTASEWAARSVGFRATVDNVGPLSLAQCPSFYRAMDGVVFPSLLECFSATPLEAMFMERPLFASDRGFVRDCCADNARYFEPTDPADAAAAIIDWYENTAADERQARVDAARRHVLAMPDSRDRARRYMEIILRELGLPAPT